MFVRLKAHSAIKIANYENIGQKCLFSVKKVSLRSPERDERNYCL